MRLIFDQNISHRILKELPDRFSDATTIKSEGLINATDKEIWEFAKKSNLTIVTQDSDFNDLNSVYGFPPKIIWLRLGNLLTIQIAKIILTQEEEIINFINNKAYGCFEITHEDFK
ncbi:DUF5615 family PIN-like protein [Marivirga sp.]|uniref:DUF5615 family PIN-like protein n=1 Tax=Marivirga sp. TaxID=2018662 RepID=UPI002D8107F7|nr:DUF5615 family PIN-like protein [Marivirga sp.]HET8861584.1 DUF5615 family PIN-like protein [Marivirga sp.]